MASSFPHPPFFLILLAIPLLLLNNILGYNISESELLDATSSATATWYGDPNGPGSVGGACGFTDDVGKRPYNSFVTAGNNNIYLGGKGCGNCYEVSCNQPQLCSGKPIRVTVTDQCPGCTDAPFHFDLSGVAFTAMANPGKGQALRDLGKLNIQYRRVPCNYGGAKIAFKVDRGSTASFFSAAIEYVNGDGGLKSVAIASAGSSVFQPMQSSWGANWKANINPSFRPPFSFKLTSPSGQTIQATNAVPANFVPGNLYTSNVNF